MDVPSYAVRRLFASAPRAVLHVVHAISVRLKRANLPLLIAFISALFMFLRALSGAGYADPDAVAEASSVLLSGSGNNFTHVPAPPPVNPDHGFTGYWNSFKGTLFICPEGAGTDALQAETKAKTRVACLREQLGALGGRVMAAGGARVAPEDRAFRASLDVMPPRQPRAEEGDSELALGQ